MAHTAPRDPRFFRYTRSLLIGIGVAVLGCACAASTQTLDQSPPKALASLAVPSQHPDLPDGSSLRIALGDSGSVGLAIIQPDHRIWGTLSLRPIRGLKAQAVHIEFRAGSMEEISADAEVVSGGVAGSVSLRERHASWRVTHEPDGSLSGRRWSPALARRCDSLQLAREVASELDLRVSELGTQAQLSALAQREVLEEVRLAQLALELGLRACEGRGRAALPTLTGPFAWR